MAYANLGQVAPSQVRSTAYLAPTAHPSLMVASAIACPAGTMQVKDATGRMSCMPVVTSFTPLTRPPPTATPAPVPETPVPEESAGLGTGGILLLIALGGGALYWYTQRKKKPA
jgi:hypothetical protein